MSTPFGEGSPDTTLSDLPITTDFIHLPSGFQEAEAYNAESARLQVYAGVDPSQCLTITVVQGDQRTSAVDFFGSLKQGRWLSPNEGKWLEHDKTLHWLGVRATHPHFVPVVMWAAALGEKHLQANRNEEAIEIGTALDYFVDWTTNSVSYYKLLKLCGIRDIAPEFDFGKFNEHRSEIQILMDMDLI